MFWQLPADLTSLTLPCSGLAGSTEASSVTYQLRSELYTLCKFELHGCIQCITCMQLECVRAANSREKRVRVKEFFFFNGRRRVDIPSESFLTGLCFKPTIPDAESQTTEYSRDAQPQQASSFEAYIAQ